MCVDELSLCIEIMQMYLNSDVCKLRFVMKKQR